MGRYGRIAQSEASLRRPHVSGRGDGGDEANGAVAPLLSPTHRVQLIGQVGHRRTHRGARRREIEAGDRAGGAGEILQTPVRSAEL